LSLCKRKNSKNQNEHSQSQKIFAILFVFTNNYIFYILSVINFPNFFFGGGGKSLCVGILLLYTAHEYKVGLISNSLLPFLPVPDY
jgi:hypothetical protein